MRISDWSSDVCSSDLKTCYIESSPTNDALVYLTLAEAEGYLDEAERMGTREIGFTGGEPFMNRDMIAMMQSAPRRGFDVLVLTNAMRPMRRFEAELVEMARAGRKSVVSGKSVEVRVDLGGRRLLK